MSVNQQIPENPSTSSALAEALQGIHPDLELWGELQNMLLNSSDGLLAYVWSLLKDESPMRPEASVGQWSDLLCVLAPHAIVPLVYWKISALPHDLRPPEPITDQMRMAFMESHVRCLRMERQLGEILNAFQDQGVRALVTRGPALACSVYPDPVLRPSSDLDLLVLPEQVIQARGILEGLGYKCLSKRFEIARDFFREEDFIHQENPRDNVPVDLHWVHWELHPFFGSSRDVGLEDLFLRPSKVESSSLTFETLHPVDALIHAAIHLAMIHTREMRLIWIYDIARLARHLRVPDDWKTLQEGSVAWRARLSLETSLKTAHVWVGLHVPDGFNDFSTWPKPTADEHTTWSHVTRDHWVNVLLSRYLSHPLGLLKMVRPLFRLLFPPPDIMRYCYPPKRNWLLPLSYIRRWHRWFKELVLNRMGP